MLLAGTAPAAVDTTTGYLYGLTDWFTNTNR